MGKTKKESLRNENTNEKVNDFSKLAIRSLKGKQRQPMKILDAASQYVCPRCNIVFVSRKHLRFHSCTKMSSNSEHANHQMSGDSSLRLRDFNQPIKSNICPVCQAAFNSSAEFRSHLKTHVRTYTCNVCKQIFNTMDEWKMHIKMSANASHCYQCAQNFGCITVKLQHKCESSLLVCFTCGISFKKRWALQRHEQWHISKKKNCPICNKQYLRLDCHMRLHKNQDYKSRESEISTATSSSALPSPIQHSTKEENESNPDSPENSDQLIHPPRVVSNQKREYGLHGVQQRTCAKCSRVCSSTRKLSYHKRFHCRFKTQKRIGPGTDSTTALGVYKCPRCFKAFKSKRTLFLHQQGQYSCQPLVKYSNENCEDNPAGQDSTSFACDQCSANFQSINELRFHRIFHFGSPVTKPGEAAAFVCAHCNQYFQSDEEFHEHCDTFSPYLFPSHKTEACLPETNAKTLEPTEVAQLPEEAAESKERQSKVRLRTGKDSYQKPHILPNNTKETGEKSNETEGCSLATDSETKFGKILEPNEINENPSAEPESLESEISNAIKSSPVPNLIQDVCGTSVNGATQNPACYKLNNIGVDHGSLDQEGGFKKLNAVAITAVQPKNDEVNGEPPNKKNRKCSLEMRALVAQVLKVIRVSSVSRSNPHVCSLCEKEFYFPMGINSHYLRKHTAVEIMSVINGVSGNKDSMNISSDSSNLVVDPSFKNNSPHLIDDFKAEGRELSAVTETHINHSNVKVKELPKPDVDFDEDLCSSGLLSVSAQIYTKSAEVIVPAVEQEALSELREHFSKLFCHLVGDDGMLAELGWPNRLIDEVLVDVLTQCSRDPCTGTVSVLHSLRSNISTLLNVCIKEQTMEKFGWNEKLVDEVVKEMLEGGDIIM